MNPTPALPADADARLRDIFADILGLPAEDVGPALDRSTTANWSSLNHLLLISEIELRFEVAFSNAEIAAVQGYGDVSGALARQLQRAVERQ